MVAAFGCPAERPRRPADGLPHRARRPRRVTRPHSERRPWTVRCRGDWRGGGRCAFRRGRSPSRRLGSSSAPDRTPLRPTPRLREDHGPAAGPQLAHQRLGGERLRGVDVEDVREGQERPHPLGVGHPGSRWRTSAGRAGTARETPQVRSVVGDDQDAVAGRAVVSRAAHLHGRAPAAAGGPAPSARVGGMLAGAFMLEVVQGAGPGGRRAGRRGGRCGSSSVPPP
jgi:hypothetical protein